MGQPHPSCPFCGSPVDIKGRDLHNKDVFQEVTGWAAIRTHGGTNQVSLRKVSGRYAHGRCVRLEARGITVRDQGRLL